MNILYIIGNGFDLNLKLKTSYSDFFKYFIAEENESKIVGSLKKHINSDEKNWSDLELAFGKFTQSLNTLEEFDDVFDNIKDSLGNYLIEEEKKFNVDDIDKQVFLDYLIYPERALLPLDKTNIINHKNKWKGQQWNIDITTFNYTRILEKIFDNKITNIPFGTHKNGSNVILRRIEHIHGYVDRNMVFGVNDISQISNNKFTEDINIIESIIKEECNKANKHTLEQLFKRQILNSHMIVIFGSSIGETDKIWWEAIGERLKGDCILLIFTIGEELRARHEQKGLRFERRMKNFFLEKTKLSDSEKKDHSAKIFIGLNTNMFNFKPRQVEE